MERTLDAREQRVLVFALFGGDSAHTERILGSIGVATERCADMAVLCRSIAEGAGAVVLAEEALVPPAAELFLETLERQPPWSDLPVIVSTVERDLVRAGFGVAGSLGARANVMILERPVSVRAMVTAVRAALRARRRQYEARTVLCELARASELAEESCRSKDEFLATLSHELRTPLNAILGWTRMLRSDALLPEKREKALETVERNAAAQTHIIEDLLDMSRASAGALRVKARWMDLVVPVRSAIDTVRPAAEAKRIELGLALDATAGAVRGDVARLQQVVWNLLNNAVKFTPCGGRVDVSLRRVDTCVEIAVTDDGIGIAPEFLPHVFERFRQADGSTKRAQGGLGLGLALVKDIVELHGGWVRASSAGLSRGATFVVGIPRAGESRSSVARLEAPAVVRASGPRE